MSLVVDFQINNPGRYALNRERLFGVVTRVIEREKKGTSNKIQDTRNREQEKISVSLLVCNKEQMAKFNWQYHETKGPTDVLSFPYTDPLSQVADTEFISPPDMGIVLGDLIVCYPVAREIALKEGKTTQDCLDFYVEHGLMHLLGHHHE